jgi:hypothetical protein
MKSALLLFACVLAALCAPAQSVNPQNVPEGVHSCLERNALLAKYEFNARINPFYLRGDFDGDSKPDYAVAVLEKAPTRKPGIVMCGSSTAQAQVLGAGTPFAEEDAFDFDGWEVYEKRTLAEGVSGPPPKLAAEAIMIVLDETASGIIYWDGKKYDWYELTD